ncbi:MAG: WxcM-like domain-containing protein [Anaerolineae bacterium]|nr:WxcM-like domain-containing protein [Anaerolineae bacterium]
MKPQIHPKALVETNNIGKNTRVWAFVHILPGAQIGADCNLCDHVFIENEVVVGDRVTIKSGVQLWDGILVENDVFIGPNATFTNDPFPRSKQYPDTFAKTIIRKGASIGANATILPGITIGRNAMIGAGAVITKDIPPNAIVAGNPARIVNYVNTIYEEKEPRKLEGKPLNDAQVSSVRLLEFPKISDIRGNLTYAEFPGLLPFEAQRFFMVYGVPNKEVRGEHAHKKLREVLICTRGNCSIVVDDGTNRREIILNRPTLGLYIPPMTWLIQYKFSSDAILLVLASDVYKADDYIRDYDEYLDLISKQ